MSAAPDTRRWRTWARAQWLLVPLLVLGLAEAGVRATVARVPTWYGAAEALAAEGPVQVLFAGSSRTQVAIVCPVFEREALRRGAGRLRILNLGRGYSTDVEHYLGLRNLIVAQPDSLRGVTLFYEAPQGLPYVTRFRTDAWAHTEQPWMLVDLLRPSELRGLWRFSGLSVQVRLHIGLRVLLRPLALFNRRERLREHLLEQALPALARGQWPALPAGEELGYDLRGPAPDSIRQDPAAVAQARASAERIGRLTLERQGPQRNYAGTIQEHIVALLKSVGGRVVYYQPPLSELMREAYRTPMRLEDASLFADQARAWGACVVRPEFTYDDEDLPDLWHLKRERASEFTQAVAAAWLEQCPPAS